MKSLDVIYIPTTADGSLLCDDAQDCRYHPSDIAYARVRELTDEECEECDELLDMIFRFDGTGNADEIRAYAIRAWYAKLNGVKV